MKCDVIVIGAGPAGLAASIIASQAGLQTLLIEKNSEIGYPIKTSAFTFKEVINSWKLPASVMAQWSNSFYVNSVHSQRDVEVCFGRRIGGLLDFHQFLRELAFQTIKNGTKIILSDKVIEPCVKKDSVVGVKTAQRREIGSKIVIDCSGPASIIGRKLDLIPKASHIEYGIGIEYEMSNVKVRNQNSIDFYVGKKEVVPIGYGWVFPLSKNRARVGVCTVFNTPEEISEKKIEHWHEKFLCEDSPIYNQIRNAQPYEVHKGAYPLCGMYEKPYAPGLLIAGDAAAQASGLVGEGIRFAMEFGKISAKIAIESIKQNNYSDDFLKDYVTKCNMYLGEYHKVAIDLLQVPTDEYWENLVDAMIKCKKTNSELILKYLKTEMTYKDAKKIFPSFVGKYFS